MIEYADICVGLAWGDEGKGKIVSHLTKHYDYVCKWNASLQNIINESNNYVCNILLSRSPKEI